MHSFLLLPGPRDIIKEGVKRGNAAIRRSGEEERDGGRGEREENA